MKRAIFLGMIVLLTAALFLPACDNGGGGGGSSSSIVGVWTCVDSSIPGNVGRIIVFYPNGTGDWDGVAITYAYSGGILSFVYLGNPYNYALAWLTSVKIQITDTNSGNWMILVLS